MGTKNQVAKKATNYKSDSVDRGLASNYINISNALARAGHGLSLYERRIVLSAISKIDSLRMVSPGESPFIKINALEFAETFQISPESAYQNLKHGINSIMRKQISWRVKDRKGKWKITKVQWVNTAIYHEGEARCEVQFHPQLTTHLYVLRSQFTSYQLGKTAGLRSTYSGRMLDLIESWKQKTNDGFFVMEMDDLHNALDVPQSLKKDFSALRRRALEPMQKELKDQWLIDWDLIKSGRKITALRFKFKQNKQASLF